VRSIDRMNAILSGRRPDRVPFVPSIYEHGARLLGRSPGEVSRNADLMAAAARKAHELYDHDLVTVGIDLYNVEAEAFGCRLSDGAGSSIPGVTTHPLAGDDPLDAGRLAPPPRGGANRLDLLVEAARRVVESIGSEVWVYGCMGGPFSQAVELRGFEDLIGDIVDAPEAVHRLLERTTELSLDQARRLSQAGAGVYLYESWATLPLIEPGIFEAFVVPYNGRIIAAVRNEFATPPPAVIMGGDTALLIDLFLRAGTSLVVADFNTDFELIRSRIAGRPMIVRGCVDPKKIERGDWPGVRAAVNALAAKAAGMPNFVWGCGCVSYNTPAEHVLRFKEMCLAAAASSAAGPGGER
jgi:uroporphyrinogen decarboxylase